MNRRPADRSPRPTPRRGVARRRAAVVAALALALSGCGLRLETPPPQEPSPDAAEQVRARTVDAALDLEAAAGSAASSADEATAAVLDDVAAFSAEHVDALGGVYDSGLPRPTQSATSTTAPTVTPHDVLDALRAAAGSALTDADAAPDGGTARLLAAIGTARDELAARLASALGEPADGGATATTAPAPTSSGTASAQPDPTATGTAPALPAGMTDEAARALVLAHDQAGYGFEVVAAKLADDARAAARASGVRHRAAATAWAERAAIADTDRDPRRTAYALPGGLDDPTAAGALAASLEGAVAEAAAAALVGTAAGARSELVGELRDATAAARAWGAAPSAFPGLPGGAPATPSAPPGAEASDTTPRWPPETNGLTLPAHLPHDAGARSGASGEATVADDGSITYVVADGDQLGYIGLRFFPDDPMGASTALLTAVNAPGVDQPGGLKPGDTLAVPSGRWVGEG